MKHTNILKQIDKFVEQVREFFPDLQISHLNSKEYLVKERWHENSPPFFEDTGIYFLLSQEEEILLIGKSEDKIGKRACSHIEEVQPGKFHITEGTQGLVDKELLIEIERGNFFISATLVKPSYLSCLIEIFALSKCKNHDGNLPNYNSKYC